MTQKELEKALAAQGIKKDKDKASVNVSIQQTPVAGSNYYAPNGCIYPAPVTVMRVEKK